MWSNMPDTDIFITDDVQGYHVGGDVMMCWATNHPSGGLSWRQLAAVIHFTYERELSFGIALARSFSGGLGMPERQLRPR
jgi:hypothetical protein